MVAARDSHTKRSKSERERHIPYDITYMWNLKYGTKILSPKQKQITNMKKTLVVAKGEEGRSGMDWELGISRYKLLHLGWLSNTAQGTESSLLG